MPHRTPNTETELKLTIKPEDVSRLLSTPILADRADGPLIARRLESVYFDTPNFDLYRRKAVLRVRSAEGRFVQCLKSAPVAENGLTRREWETSVDDATPQLDALRLDKAARRLLRGLQADALRPVFITIINRTILSLDDGAVELAVDQGVVRRAEAFESADKNADAPRDRQAEVDVCELELELKRGTAADLYKWALALFEAAPMRIETLSKAARGYCLLLDLPRTVRKPVPSAFAGKPRGVDAFDVFVAQTARHALAHLLDNLVGAAVYGDSDCVHQARVALRRLRSAISLFRGSAVAAALVPLKSEIKALSQALGAARAWDVFLNELWPQAVADGGDADAFAALAEQARRERAAACRQAQTALSSPDCARMMLQCFFVLESALAASAAELSKAELSEAGFSEVGRPAARKPTIRRVAKLCVTRRRRRLCKMGADFETLPAVARHDLRIAIKKLHYAAHLFQNLYKKRAFKAFFKSVSALQSRLGVFNDLVSMPDMLAARRAAWEDAGNVSALTGAAAMTAWSERRLVELEDELRARWKEFSAAPRLERRKRIRSKKAM